MDLIAALRMLEPRLERYERGWILAGAGEPAPYLDLTRVAEEVNWSEELETLHADATRTHFIDQLTRHAVVASVRAAAAVPDVIADVGCSSGYLLAEVHTAFPKAGLVGVDLVGAGLVNAHRLIPDAWLLRADAAALPLDDGTVDVVVSVNLLEHVDDDLAVLRELRRVLRRQGVAVLVVPRGPELFDFFDQHLGHVRRYARGELPAKAARAGFDVSRTTTLGSVVYPAFWVQKKLNRRRGGRLTPAERAARAQHAVTRTRDSRAGRAAAAIERDLFDRGLSFRNGIRELAVLRSSER